MKRDAEFRSVGTIPFWRIVYLMTSILVLLSSTAQAIPLPASVELSSLDGKNGFTILVGSSGPHASQGATIGTAAGDVNGDLKEDFIICAPRAEAHGRLIAGQCYVVFGKDQSSQFPSQLDAITLDGNNGFTISGSAKGHLLGSSVASADFNGDQLNDIIISSPGSWYDDPSPGRLYVIYGSNSFSAEFDLSSLNGSNGFVIQGITNVTDYFVANAGDFNNDGKDDILIGAQRWLGSEDRGESFVIYGTAQSVSSPLELSSILSGDGSRGFVVEGEVTQPGVSRLPTVASAGDFNNDGFDDIIIGARSIHALGNPASGRSYIVFGTNQQFSSPMQLSSIVAGNGTQGFAINGWPTNALCGASVASAGDFNDDSFEDVVVGCPGASNGGQLYTGKSYVIFGTNQPFTSPLQLFSILYGDGTQGFVVNGDTNDNANLGESVSSAGDINDDGFSDLFLGSPRTHHQYDGTSRVGQSYVVFGGQGNTFSSPLNVSSLDGTTGFAVNGHKKGDRAGQYVSHAGDVNTDGIDDIIIGTFGKGEAYVLFGRDDDPFQPYRFVVLADSRGPDASRCASHINLCVNEIALTDIFNSINDSVDNPAFAIFVGDLVYGRKKGDTVRLEFEQWQSVIENTGFPTNKIYPVFGGHERNNPRYCDYDTRIKCVTDDDCDGGSCITDSTYTKAWSAFDSFFDPANNQGMDNCQYFDEGRFGRTAYYCDYGNARFFFLNNDCISKNDASQGAGVDKNGCVSHEIGKTQRNKISQFLENNGKELNFFFHHEPAYGVGAHGVIPPFTMDRNEYERNRYIELIGKNNATLLFCGHEHQYTKRAINRGNLNSLVVLIAAANSSDLGPRYPYSYDGDSDAAPLLHVEYSTDRTSPTIDRRINDSNNDAEEFTTGTYEGLVYLDSSDLELIMETQRGLQIVGMRWDGLGIPADAIIDSAYIQFTAKNGSTENAKVNIYGQSSTAAESFSVENNNLSGRTTTSAYVTWVIPEWNTAGQSSEQQRTPDIKNIIQEIVNNHTNSEGNFYEVKTGCAGAPWAEASFDKYKEGLKSWKIEVGDDDPDYDVLGRCSNDLDSTCLLQSDCDSGHVCMKHRQPNHYAVVEVYKNKVFLSPYGISYNEIDWSVATKPLSVETASGSERTIATVEDRHEFFANDRGNPDKIKFQTATGAGEVTMAIPMDQEAGGYALGNIYATVDTDYKVPQEKKPDMDFPYGVWSLQISVRNAGETALIEIETQRSVSEGFSYFDAAAWKIVPIEAWRTDRVFSIQLTDGGEEDADGVANGIIQHVGTLAQAKPVVVNWEIKIKPIKSTVETSVDTSECEHFVDYDSGVSGDFIGSFFFKALLKNKGQKPIKDAVIVVQEITNGNILANADFGTVGRLRVPKLGDYADGILGSKEEAYVGFNVCLRNIRRFMIRLNVEGRMEGSNATPPKPIKLTLKPKSTIFKDAAEHTKRDSKSINIKGD